MDSSEVAGEAYEQCRILIEEIKNHVSQKDEFEVIKSTSFEKNYCGNKFSLILSYFEFLIKVCNCFL